MREAKDIFLGGTCNESTWRDEFISYLKKYDCLYNYFNPVVDDWTEECQEEENFQKENCKINLFCITPKMTGVFSIAEMVESAIIKPDKTFIVIRNMDGDGKWTVGQRKLLKATRDMCIKYGAHCFTSLIDAAQSICDYAIINTYDPSNLCGEAITSFNTIAMYLISPMIIDTLGAAERYIYPQFEKFSTNLRNAFPKSMSHKEREAACKNLLLNGENNLENNLKYLNDKIKSESITSPHIFFLTKSFAKLNTTIQNLPSETFLPSITENLKRAYATSLEFFITMYKF